MTENSDEFIMTWEAPVIEKPEFRLYYDENGDVLTYTCEKPEGNYITIDALTFAEARPDVKVIDGKLVRISAMSVITRLYPSTKGILCESEDISVIANGKKGQHWELKTTTI